MHCCPIEGSLPAGGDVLKPWIYRSRGRGVMSHPRTDTIQSYNIDELIAAEGKLSPKPRLLTCLSLGRLDVESQLIGPTRSREGGCQSYALLAVRWSISFTCCDQVMRYGDDASVGSNKSWKTGLMECPLRRARGGTTSSLFRLSRSR